MHPAKAVERNEMPFGRDTRVVPSSVVLDRGSEDLGAETPSQSLHCKLQPNHYR